jgi:two-component system chemotaxis response regulator CheB
MAQRDIIVFGGSAGSLAALLRIVPELPEDLPASAFVATHIPSDRPSEHPAILGDRSALRVLGAIDGQAIERGCVYVAPPDRHLLTIDNVVRLGRGPVENMARPAIDPLFRSAALSFGSRVIGVVLSGATDDGAAGLYAIKRRNGLAIVQDPLDAEASQAPQAAIEAVRPDHVVPADAIADLIRELAGQEAPDPPPAGTELGLEVQIAVGGGLNWDLVTRLAKPSNLACPECDGVLFRIEADGPLRFRCQSGHAFSAEAALSAQRRDVDEAVLAALRSMQERLSQVRQMAWNARRHGRNHAAEYYEHRAEEYAQYADTLRKAASGKIEPLPAELGNPP